MLRYKSTALLLTDAFDMYTVTVFTTFTHTYTNVRLSKRFQLQQKTYAEEKRRSRSSEAKVQFKYMSITKNFNSSVLHTPLPSASVRSLW